MAKKIYNEESITNQLSHYWNAAYQYKEERVEGYNNAHKYYHGLLPVKEVEADGTSTCPKKFDYVAPVVRTAVDNMMPQLLNVFCEDGNEAVILRPSTINAQPTKHHELATSVLNAIYLRDNNGRQVDEEVFKEALISGDSFVKVFWEEDIDELDKEFEDWTPATALVQYKADYPHTDWSTLDKRNKKPKIDDEIKSELAQAGITEEQLNAMAGEDQVKGKVTLKAIRRKLKVETVPFGEIYPSPSTKNHNLSDTNYIAQKIVMTRGEALEMGFDKDAVMEAQIVSGDLATSHKDLFTQGTETTDEDGHEFQWADPMMEPIYITEHYFKSSLPTRGNKVSLYQAFTTGEGPIKLLEKPTKVTYIPYIHAVPFITSTSFWGDSFFNMFSPLQDAQTIMMDNLLHYAGNASFDRYIALKGQYDRRSLLDHRPGGVVEVKEKGALSTLPLPTISPVINTAIEKLDNEEKKYISSAVSEAISNNLNNVAASTVAMAVDNEELKGKVIAHTLGETFRKPLFELMMNMLREEGVPGLILPSNVSYIIDINTKDDRAKEVAFHMSQANQRMALLKDGMSEQEVYNHIKHVYSVAAVSGFDEMYSNPQDNAKAKAQAQAEAKNVKDTAEELDLEKKAAEVTYLKAQAASEASKVELDKETKKLELATKIRTNELKEQEILLKNKELMLQYQLEKEQKRGVSLDD